MACRRHDTGRSDLRLGKELGHGIPLGRYLFYTLTFPEVILEHGMRVPRSPEHFWRRSAGVQLLQIAHDALVVCMQLGVNLPVTARAFVA